MPGDRDRVFHLQLRQFPHNHCRFNLSEADVGEFARRWALDQWVEVGERRWSAHQAQLTILAGPPLTVAQLAMGRGWRNAERSGEDVTERVLEAFEQRKVRRAEGTPADLALLADSVGLELLALIDLEPAPLSDAYSLARARLPDDPASECLALAERAVQSLRARALVEIARAGEGATTDRALAAHAPALAEHEAELALRALESWVDPAPSERVWVRRA